MSSYPGYADIQARHLARRRRAAIAAAREAAAAAARAGGRLIVFGSLATGRFHRRSDLDLALEGPEAIGPGLATEVARIAATHGLAADVVWLAHAPPALSARIRSEGRDAAGLE